jgi:hypothetical protein
MTTIHSRVRDGRIEADAPADWPDGTPVEILPLADQREPVGIEESAWRDDSAALVDWAAWLPTVEPPILTPDEVAQATRFEEKMREYNLDAVRRQMDLGPRS